MSETMAGRAERLAGVMALVAGWSPDLFWSATPHEAAGVLSAATGAGEGVADPADRARLDRMMEQFPDG